MHEVAQGGTDERAGPEVLLGAVGHAHDHVGLQDEAGVRQRVQEPSCRRGAPTRVHARHLLRCLSALAGGTSPHAVPITRRVHGNRT